MVKFIRTKENLIYCVDPIGRGISSVEEAPYGYNIFYFDVDQGQHLERDGKGGMSMDCIYKEDIIKASNELEGVVDYLVEIIPYDPLNYPYSIDIYQYKGDGEWRNVTGFGKQTLSSMEALQSNGFKYKLAILTEDGLKFVADVGKGMYKLR